MVEDINARHVNTLFLPDVPLPAGIRAGGDPAEVVPGADLVVLVPPSKYLRAVSERIASHVSRGALVVVATKGIEEGTLTLMSEVLAETLPAVDADHLAFLSGPSFAREVARGLPTDVSVASRRAIAARAAQKLLHAPTFRVYTSADPIGVQVGGAVKNVIAVAAGACDGLSLGTNARAALIARGLAEITRLGVALGANPLTFLGMAGVGDLVLTCTGPLSRNRTLGTKLAEGVDPQAYLASKSAASPRASPPPPPPTTWRRSSGSTCPSPEQVSPRPPPRPPAAGGAQAARDEVREVESCSGSTIPSRAEGY